MTMGISMPKSLKEIIDDKRGDVSRSRYISKILKRQIMCRPEECNLTHENVTSSTGVLNE